MDRLERQGLDESLAQWLAPLLPLPGEAIAAPMAAGRVLAKAVHAWRPLPAFRRSAVDGYAVRAHELAEEALVDIVADPVWAGQARRPLAPGQAVYIATGAAVPDGADAVLPLEIALVGAADQGCGRLRAVRPVAPGANVREVGEDLPTGTRALRAGERIDGDRLPLLLAAAAGRAVLVVRRPRVQILPTGDELEAPGKAPEGAHAMEVIGTTLALRAVEDGAQAGLAAPLPDSLPGLRDALRSAAAGADLVVTVGGASAGRRDHAAGALVEAGGRLRFRGLRLRPGTPTFGGYLGDCAVLGLPGNPVAALTAWELVGRAVLARLLGTAAPPALTAALAASSVKRPVRDDRWLRAHLWLDGGRMWARIPPRQNAGMLVPMARTNGLVLHPGGQACLEAGTQVQVRLTGRLDNEAPAPSGHPS